MSKKRKNFIRLIAVFVTVIILGSAVRVGMYYFEYRQEKAVLQYLRENKNNSPIRELVTAKGKPYQKSSIKYDIDGDGEKEIEAKKKNSPKIGLRLTNGMIEISIMKKKNLLEQWASQNRNFMKMKNWLM